MTHIGNLMSDAALFADYPGTELERDVPAAASDADIAKATIVLRALAQAGLRAPFDFPGAEEAKRLWGVRLGEYSLEVLTEAVKDFIDSPTKDWPTLGQVASAAAFIIAERIREERIADAFTSGACVECDDIHWVRVYPPGTHFTEDGLSTDPTVQHIMAPCPRCPEMTTYRELWDHNHFTAEHVARGGCPQCRDYQRPWSESQRKSSDRRRAGR